MAEHPVTRRRSQPRRWALAITLAYMLVSFLWIAFSDRWVFHNLSPEQADRWSTLKGWAFVVVTGSVIYVLLLSRLSKLWRAEQELGRLNRALRAMSECSQAMIGASDVNQLLGDICRIIVECGGYRMVCVGIAEDDPAKTIRPLAHAGCEQGYLQAIRISWDENDVHGGGPAGRAIRSGKPEVCQDMASEPSFGPWRDLAIERGYASNLAVPLISHGKAWGVLAIYLGQPRVLDQKEIGLLTELANDLAFGVDTLQVRQRTRLHSEELERQILQREVAEAALRDGEARLRLAVEAARLVVWEWNAKTNMIKWDATNNRIQSGPLASFSGDYQTFQHLIHPADRQMLDAAVAGVRQANAPFDLEFRVVNREMEARWVWALGRVRRDSADGIEGMIGVAQDITDRKNTEEKLLQSLKMEAVGRLAGGIAHDYNNLLAVISGYSESLLRHLEPGTPSHTSAEEIDKAATRASGLTKQLLAFSRQQIVRPEPLDLNRVITDAQPLLRQSLSDKIDLVIQLEPDLYQIKADRGQMEQVLMNLVLNAREAIMKKNGGKMTIAIANLALDESNAPARRLPPGDYVSLQVRDTGAGMSPQVLQRVFEPFFTTKDVLGTGLGLSIVYGIVQQAGGSVFVQSQADVGSFFEILLPRLMPPA